MVAVVAVEVFGRGENDVSVSAAAAAAGVWTMLGHVENRRFFIPGTPSINFRKNTHAAAVPDG